ncbi:flagellar basal body rod protein FlgB [Fulvimonas yonginensis]|uniref:Flagellar basal body rod protein FlgB n=1 Tax=Fulvimonas yonginensis TaxID=1495200 RepID=A0ABU8JA15_9GAMM
MSQPIDNLFGMHTGALALWQRRTEVLASNLANADTPGYLARDIDFRKALAAAAGGAGDGSLPLAAPTPGQIDPVQQANDTLAYRVPTQPSMDGNTVDAQVEQAAFAANSVHYQASLAFITAQIRMLRTAITGGQG